MTAAWVFLIQVLSNFSNMWSNFIEGLNPMTKRMFEEHPYVFLIYQELP